MGGTRNYSKTILYKIIDKRYNVIVYIGHTTNLYEKKKHIKRNKNGINNFINEQGGWDNFIVLYLKSFPFCISKSHADSKVYEEYKILGIPEESDLEKVYRCYSNENI